MKILDLAVDATPLLEPKTGVGNYTAKLIQTLKLSNNPLRLNMFYGYKWSQEVKDAPDPAITLETKHFFKRNIPKAYNMASSIIKKKVFNFGVKKYRPDILHGPNFIAPNFSGPTVITVYDLSYLKYPETLPAERLEWLQKNLPGAINQSSRILTISNFVKKEIIAHFSLPEDKVEVTYLGVDSSFHPLAEPVLQNQLKVFDLKPNQYVLNVGTIEPRKNLKTLIHAYSRLPAKTREKYPLVLAGMRGWKESSLIKDIEPLEQKGQVRILGYVPQEVLPALYGGAKVFVYPSFYEGFGMPVTESMACGTPVIASDCSSIPEVVGESGILLDPDDIDRWTNALAEIIENDEKYNLLKKRGLEKASSFSWEKTAEKTFQVYCEVISGKVNRDR